jgi:hypothetical protein
MAAHGPQEEGRIAISQSNGRSGSLGIQHLVQGLQQGRPGGGQLGEMAAASGIMAALAPLP